MVAMNTEIVKKIANCAGYRCYKLNDGRFYIYVGNSFEDLLRARSAFFMAVEDWNEYTALREAFNHARPHNNPPTGFVFDIEK